MTARGWHHEHVGAPSMDDLEEAGLVRCGTCDAVADPVELEDGRCADCQPSELSTVEELRP